MASRRNLKKDIQYIYSELLSECFTLSMLFPDIKKEESEAIFNKILVNNNDFIKRVSKTDGKCNSKIVKTYYRKLVTDLLTDASNISKELQQLHKNS
ncbi:MAG: hypothetical protein EOL95_01715 [Bacteroidia bacterium]|nr:hypothetical protein [Bacteroidia bacterium]